jgi:hypothetical protein
VLPIETFFYTTEVRKINELSITDIYGEQIYRTGVLNLSPKLCIPISAYPAGIYFIKVKK